MPNFAVCVLLAVAHNLQPFRELSKAQLGNCELLPGVAHCTSHVLSATRHNGKEALQIMQCLLFMLKSVNVFCDGISAAGVSAGGGSSDS